MSYIELGARGRGPRRGVREFVEILEPYVLAGVLSLSVEVGVEVQAVLLAALALLAALLGAVLDEGPLVGPSRRNAATGVLGVFVAEEFSARKSSAESRGGLEPDSAVWAEQPAYG